MKRKNILLIHFFFWFYIVNQSLFPLYIGQYEASWLYNNQYLKDVFINTMLNVVSFYVIYLLFPVLMKFRYKLVAIMAGMIVLLLLTAIRTPLELIFWKLPGNKDSAELVFKWMYVWNNLRLVIITGIYAVLIRFMIHSFESQKQKDELINQRQASELALLRSQVNPHFLFNTLNNIYSLVYKKSDLAPAAVMKLSSVMRYMFFDASADKVPLDKELDYLKSFIELQKLRISHPDFVSLQIEGNPEGHLIAPMLLISFVENAFKHSSKLHSPGIIIRLFAGKEGIVFSVVNYLKRTKLPESEIYSGIGLANIRRRLELTYPGRHKLTITQNEEQFSVNLEIWKEAARPVSHKNPQV